MTTQVETTKSNIRQSRTGKKPIPLPKGVTATMKDGTFEVKGPTGSLSRVLPPNVDVKIEGGHVDVVMTLTSPGCPSGPEIMGDAERMLKAMPGVGAVSVNLVWSPMWTPDRIEPRVRAYMGL